VLELAANNDMERRCSKGSHNINQALKAPRSSYIAQYGALQHILAKNNVGILCIILK
jgi:hypothetical protein